MLSIVCAIRLADGLEVCGKIEAKFPGVAYAIEYGGAVEQLSPRPQTGTPSDLELLFQLAARKLDGILLVTKTGGYELRSRLSSAQPA